jgi:hypothetical protein
LANHARGIAVRNCPRSQSVIAHHLPRLVGDDEGAAGTAADPNGGNGWMRIMRFDTAANTIDVDSYSPTLQAVRTAAKSDFTLSVNFADYALEQGMSFAAFQQGVAGYAGTQDTWINQQSPNASYGNSGTRTSDDDVSNSIFAVATVGSLDTA